jgi:hypothetical protein
MRKMKETTGKIALVPNSLDEMMGFNQLARYGTLVEAEYSEKVTQMTRTELEDESRRLNVVVVDSDSRLRDNLMKEFRQYVAYLRKPAPAKASKAKSQYSEEFQKILSEGK